MAFDNVNPVVISIRTHFSSFGSAQSDLFSTERPFFTTSTSYSKTKNVKICGEFFSWNNKESKAFKNIFKKYSNYFRENTKERTNWRHSDLVEFVDLLTVLLDNLFWFSVVQYVVRCSWVNQNLDMRSSDANRYVHCACCMCIFVRNLSFEANNFSKNYYTIIWSLEVLKHEEAYPYFLRTFCLVFRIS